MPAKQSKECPVHAFQRHGREAEELRAGIEKLVETADCDGPVAQVLADLRQLLDCVDARDSLAYGERNPTHRKAAHKKGAQE